MRASTTSSTPLNPSSPPPRPPLPPPLELTAPPPIPAPAAPAPALALSPVPIGDALLPFHTRSEKSSNSDLRSLVLASYYSDLRSLVLASYWPALPSYWPPLASYWPILLRPKRLARLETHRDLQKPKETYKEIQYDLHSKRDSIRPALKETDYHQQSCAFSPGQESQPLKTRFFFCLFSVFHLHLTCAFFEGEQPLRNALLIACFHSACYHSGFIFHLCFRSRGPSLRKVE